MQRRTFLKSSLAIAPVLFSAQFTKTFAAPLKLGAITPKQNDLGQFFITGKDEFGGFQAYILNQDYEIKKQIILPNRFHGQAKSAQGHLAVFSRRPLNHLCLINPNGEVRIKECSDDRHFFGHGAFSANGKLLYASENLFDHQNIEQTGRIGVWDSEKAVQITDFSSGGIGPHQILLSPNGQYLIVANGGILTHPDFPRKKLNLDEMQANIAIINAKTGKVEKRFVLPSELHQLSMRHIDVNMQGEIVIAMQYQGKRQDQVPLLAIIDKEMKMSFAKMDTNIIAKHQQYIGSIAYDKSGEFFAASSPRGNIISFYKRDGQYIDQLEMPDCCAISGSNSPSIFNVANGMGEFWRVKVEKNIKNRQVLQLEITQKSKLTPHWDNHMVAI